MPIYEYQCSVCGKVQEKLVLKSSEDEAYCKHQDQKVICKKIISPSTFHLKGCGWARDGYRDKLTPENNPENRGDPNLIAADHADIIDNNERVAKYGD